MTYRDQVYHYLVREYRGDRLSIAVNGQTDNISVAFDMARNSRYPAQVFDVWVEEIIYRNY